jgi:hypothetical protein
MKQGAGSGDSTANPGQPARETEAAVEAPVVDVFGDTPTNGIILVMALIAWIAQYAVASRCTC